MFVGQRLDLIPQTSRTSSAVEELMAFKYLNEIREKDFLSKWWIVQFEHEPFFKEILIDLIHNDGHVLQFATRVGKADVDIGDVLVLDHLHQICRCAHV